MTTLNTITIEEILSATLISVALPQNNSVTRQEIHHSVKVVSKLAMDAASVTRHERMLAIAKAPKAAYAATFGNRCVPVYTGNTITVRKSAVFGGEPAYIQSFEIKFPDKDDYYVEINPQIQRLADSAEKRGGYIKESPSKMGFMTVNKGKKKQYYGYRKDGFSEELITLQLTGPMSDQKGLEATICDSARPIAIRRTSSGFGIYVLKTLIVRSDVKGFEALYKSRGIKIKLINVMEDKKTKDYAIRGYVNVGAVREEDTILSPTELLAQITADNGKCNSTVVPMPWLVYMGNINSTSTARKGDFVLRKVDPSTIVGTPEECVAVRNAVLNDIGAGVIDIMNTVNENGKEINAEKLVKKMGRPSLVITNSAAGVVPENILIFNGKFKALNGVEFADGFGFASSRWMQKSFEKLGYKDISNAAGVGVQCRLVASKGMVFTLEPEAMTAVIEARRDIELKRCNTAINSIVFVDKNNEAECHELALALEGYENVSDRFKDLKGKLIFVGQPSAKLGDVDYFCDLNMLKAAFDFGHAKELSIMEINHPCHGAFTSSQLLQCAAGAPNFMDRAMDIAKRHIDKLFESKTKETFSHKEVVGSDSFVDSFLEEVNPAYVEKQASLLKKRYERIQKQAMKAMNNFRFDIEGGYAKGIPDLGCFFGFSLLNESEIFIDDIASHRGEDSIVVRYPHTSTREFFSAKIVTKQDFYSRVYKGMADNILTKRVGGILLNVVDSIQKGLVMLPSWDETVVAKLGGADFDGDGFFVITDKNLVAIYKNLEEGAIKFNSVGVGDTLKYGPTAYETARLYGLMNGNYSTGEAVNFAYLLSGLYLDIINDKLKQEDWTKLIKEYHKSKKQLDSYYEKNQKQSPYITLSLENKKLIKEGDITDLIAKAESGEEINEKEVRQLFDSVQGNFSLERIENLKVVLEQMNPAMASVVGRIIDAVKTGEKVMMPFSVLKLIAKDGAKLPVYIGKDKYAGLFISPNVGLTLRKDAKTWTIDNKNPSLVYVTQDPCYDLKVELVKYTNEKLNELRDQFKAIEDREIANIKKDTEAIKSHIRGCDVMAKTLGNMVSCMMAAKTVNASKDGFIPTSEMLSYAVSMYRWATLDKTPLQRLEAAKIASFIPNNENPEEGTKFGRFYNTLGAEHIMSAMYKQKEKLVATEFFAFERNTTVTTGEQISFIDGKNDKFYTAEKVTASGIVVEECGHTYMISSLRNTANEIINNSAAQNKVAFQIKYVLDRNALPASNNADVRIANCVKNDGKDDFSLPTRLLKQYAGKNDQYPIYFKKADRNAAKGTAERVSRLEMQTTNGFKGVCAYVFDYAAGSDETINNKLDGKRIIVDNVITLTMSNGSQAHYVLGTIEK